MTGHEHGHESGEFAMDPRALLQSGGRAMALPALAKSFPAIQVYGDEIPGLRPWNALELNDWLATTRASVSCRMAVAFVLHVSNARAKWFEPFNVFEALALWDPYNRAVFLEWARDPWWP